MTEPITYSSPVLLAKLVQGMNENLKQNLDWMELTYPVAKTVYINRDDTEYRFPGVYKNDGSAYHIAIAPDHKVRSFSFFEIADSFEIDGESEPFGISGNTSFPVSLIVWANLPKINAGKSYDFTEELIQDILQNGKMKDVPGLVDIQDFSIEMRTEEVFVRYDYDQAERQFMLFPYSAFKINMTLIADIDLCQ
jgi:hypothetical protein